MKQSVTIQSNWIDFADKLPPEQQGLFYSAICHYARNGTQPDLPEMLAATFDLIRPAIDQSVKRRAAQPFRRVNDLIEVAKPFCPPQREKKEMAKVFQALRIEINQEVESLKEMLQQCKELLKPGGRLVVITYHSIEDRLVKNFMKSGNIEGTIEKDFFGRSTSPFVTQKPIMPTPEELERNPRSRSAKLRVAIKKEEM